MKNDFTEATVTKDGSAVRNLKFNSIPGLWLGQVWDKTSLRDDKWTSASWTKTGKCTNKRRPELDLK